MRACTCRASLLGQGRLVAYNSVDALQAAATLVALVIGFAFFSIGTTGALVLYAAGFYVAAAAYTVLALRGARSLRFRPELARSMVGYSMKLYLASMVMFLLLRLDMLFVNAFIGADAAGQYSVATAIADALTLLPIVIGINLLPRVAREGGWQPTAEIFRGVAVLFGLLCLISVPLAAVGIPLVFGESYRPAIDLYYWLVPGIFSFGMISILAHHFGGRGMPRGAVLIWIPGLVVNVVMNVALLPSRGTYIASLSSSVGYTLVLVLAIGLFAREGGGLGALTPRFGDASRLIRVSLSSG